MEEPKLPEIPNVKTEEEQTKELTEMLTNLQFFSDQVRFNSIVYQGLSVLLEKLTKIEESLNKDGKI
jgi:hypothetical protein